MPLVDGGSISGATTQTLLIDPVSIGDAGTYDVQAGDACGTTTSAGALLAVSALCYANCDDSTIAPVLNVNDFICFQTRFAAGDPYANCDGSTASPVLNVNDFICFQTRFAAGCP
jgi:hypothetical protein